MPTLHELVATARHRLYAAGIPPAEADLDARLLLERTLGWDAARYFAHGDESAAPELIERYDTQIQRRERREPVAYISGIQEFWGLPFEVSPAVLIPRPETELIVEIALKEVALERGDRQAPLRIADVCTGSGCLAVALALEYPHASVTGTDISPAALAVAARNVERHHVAGRVQLRCADLLQGVADRFDLIVANPPYVPEADAVMLQPEVVRYEPHVALFAAGDGLSIVRALVAAAPASLAPGGTLIFEFGSGQADAVSAIVAENNGLVLVAIRADLQGIPRTAIVRKP